MVLRDYRIFWMGHRGDMENRYTTNRQRLPEQVVEDMREAYRRSEEFLQTVEVEGREGQGGVQEATSVGRGIQAGGGREDGCDEQE